jgi:phage shock protein PspC (stress-responsive transcriptional regulator)
MNKTVTINISGIIFHIEEDAYEILSKYLSTIKGYFNKSEGRDEIVSDIESRIAEMLQERVSPQKQVVLMADVEQVMSVMGKPEEFAGDQSEDEAKAGSGASDEGQPTGRKRLFRDPDDKMLGGVCAGISHYFDIDVVWLRLALAISFFVFGFGLLLYILLWIIIPQAKTTAEKLEMHREAVNIHNIKRSFQEEMDDLKKKVKDFKKEASDFGSGENKERMKKGAGRIGEFIEEFFHVFGRFVGKFFAAIFILIGVGLLIGLLASVFGFHSNNVHFGFSNGNIDVSLKQLVHLIFTDGRLVSLSILAVVLVLGIPFLMLIYGGIRILFGLGKSNKILRIFAAILWGSGFVLGFYLVSVMGTDFAESNKIKQSTFLKPAGNTLYVRVAEVTKESEEFYESKHKHHSSFFEIKNGQVYGYYPSVDILPSANDSFEITVLNSARGATEKEALNRARNIQYHFSVKDSVLELDPSFYFMLEDKWRKQEVRIVVKVPRKKMIHLSRNMQPLVHNSDIANVQDTNDDEMIDRTWIMTEDGLDCIDCQGLDVIRPRQRHREEPEAPQAPLPPKHTKNASFIIF